MAKQPTIEEIVAATKPLADRLDRRYCLVNTARYEPAPADPDLYLDGVPVWYDRHRDESK